jgi:hypothetical protein
VPLLDQSVLITDGLVPVLYPGAGAVERPQEKLYIFLMDLVIFGFNLLLNLPRFSLSRLGFLLILIDFSSSGLRLVLRLGLLNPILKNGLYNPQYYASLFKNQITNVLKIFFWSIQTLPKLEILG